MILLSFLLAQSAVLKPIPASEIRKGITLRHFCVMEEANPQTGFKDVGLLFMNPGKNLPDVTLSATSKGRPALFEKGMVVRAEGQRDATSYKMVADLKGERNGRPANMILKLQGKSDAGAAATVTVALVLTQDAQTSEFWCAPYIGAENNK